jgi:hypothetical protein
LQDEPGILVSGRTVLEQGASKGRAAERAAPAAVTERAAVSLYSSRSKTIGLSDDDLLVVGSLKSPIFPICDVDPVAETLLRFLEYDRTPAELAGGAYTGTGSRETLGQTATDEFGNYVYRFSRTIGELIAEVGDIATGEVPAVAALPDLIIQILESLPAGVAFETAPYYDIPNIKRIDLCIPESELDGVEQPCQSGRAIQTLGNIERDSLQLRIRGLWTDRPARRLVGHDLHLRLLRERRTRGHPIHLGIPSRRGGGLALHQ